MERAGLTLIHTKKLRYISDSRLNEEPPSEPCGLQCGPVKVRLPPTSTPSPSPAAGPPSPGIVAPPSPPVARSPIVMPPPAHVLYVGRELVRRGCQTAHWHGRCNVRNEHRAKKGRQSDESCSDVFHGRFLRFAVQMLAHQRHARFALRKRTSARRQVIDLNVAD